MHYLLNVTQSYPIINNLTDPQINNLTDQLKDKITIDMYIEINTFYIFL